MSSSVLWDLFVSLGRANLFGFGGGPTVVPLIEREVVDHRGWLTPAEFGDALVVGNSLPGPITTKLATHIGWKVAGAPGAAVALLATVLPSAAGMLALFGLLHRYRDVTFVKGMMAGVKPVVWVLFLLLVVDYLPFVRTLPTAVIAILSLILVWGFKVEVVWVIVGSMLVGGLLAERGVM